jgi:hypothetical protein
MAANNRLDVCCSPISRAQLSADARRRRAGGHNCSARACGVGAHAVRRYSRRMGSPVLLLRLLQQFSSRQCWVTETGIGVCVPVRYDRAEPRYRRVNEAVVGRRVVQWGWFRGFVRSKTSFTMGAPPVGFDQRHPTDIARERMPPSHLNQGIGLGLSRHSQIPPRYSGTIGLHRANLERVFATKQEQRAPSA